MFKYLLAASFFACLFLTVPAESMLFGLEDNLHRLEDIQVKGPNGESLYLGYRTTIHFMLAGIYIVDQGYILGDQSSSNKYYQLDKKIITEMQSAGQLPLKMPPYKIDLSEYILGYSMWIAVGLGLLKFLTSHIVMYIQDRKNTTFKTTFGKFLYTAKKKRPNPTRFDRF